MNEELQKRLADSIGQVQQFVSSTADFAKAQVPLVVQELIQYGFWSNVLWMLVGLAVLVTARKAAGWYRAHKWDDKYGADADRIFPLFGIGILIAVGLAITLCCANEALEITFAPRLYVVEKVSSLAGHGHCK